MPRKAAAGRAEIRKRPARHHRANSKSLTNPQPQEHSKTSAKIQSASRLDRLADALLAGGLHRAAEAISLRAAALREVVA